MRSTLRTCRLLVIAIASILAPVDSLSRQLNSSRTKIDGEMMALKKGTLCERMSAIIELHDAGERAIPALIYHIGDTDLAPDSAELLASPILSSRPPESQNDYFAGVLYAYSVELILGRATVSAARRSPLRLWEDVSKRGGG